MDKHVKKKNNTTGWYTNNKCCVLIYKTYFKHITVAYGKAVMKKEKLKSNTHGFC